jgi:myo-inositol-1(or 4)-monophosphatase
MATIIKYQQICQDVEDIAMEAGNFIRNERKKISEEDVKLKSAASLVTYVDTTSEEQIVKALKKIIPKAGFITEEETVTEKGKKFNWIIDPLDGTTNYIHGISPHSVSIALMENDELVLGVVYEIGLNEMFRAWKGSPAFLNGKEITVATASEPENTLIGTGFPYYNFDRVDGYIRVLKHLMKSTRGLRRFGSAAVDLSYVASGRFNAFFEHGLHAWDVAAGALILKQAGGVVSDFNGGNNWLYGGEIIAASKNFFDPLYNIINQYLGSK